MISNLKERAVSLLPVSARRVVRGFRRLPRLVRNLWADGRRYAANSAILGVEKSREHLTGVITATYHNIEKGLSLPSPRLGFGVPMIQKLIWLLKMYERDFGFDRFSAVPIGVLRKYLDYHHERGAAKPALERDVVAFEHALFGRVSSTSRPEVGTRTIHRSDIARAVSGVGPDFFLKRHSVRKFAPDSVATEKIVRAVQAAQKAPGVCNRQSGRIRQIVGASNIEVALKLQGGARGFAENVPALFCISADIRNFGGAGERYQGWIDGGLFAMSFILALHAETIGTCCLNWSKEVGDDRAMHKLLGLPDYEIIIMFVAAGNLLDEYPVAVSTRRPIEEVFSIIADDLSARA